MITIGMMMFDGMTQLDLTGPLEVFSRFPEIKIHLISKTIGPVKCDRGLTIIPDTSFETCPAKLQVLFVPGGPGVSGLLKDDEYLNFIRSKGDSAISLQCVQVRLFWQLVDCFRVSGRRLIGFQWIC